MSNLKATGFPHNKEKSTPCYELKIIPYDNMIYIDGEKGFVFQNGKLLYCYDSISEVCQHENSEGDLVLQIGYFYDTIKYIEGCEGDYTATLVPEADRDVFQISEFDKIVVHNREIVKWETNL